MLFKIHFTNLHEFLLVKTRQNTSSKHKVYTTNVANRIPESNTSLIHVF